MTLETGKTLGETTEAEYLETEAEYLETRTSSQREMWEVAGDLWDAGRKIIGYAQAASDDPDRVEVPAWADLPTHQKVSFEMTLRVNQVPILVSSMVAGVQIFGES